MNNPLSVQETTTATSNLGTTYTVTNTNDDGEGSLRWAITESNNNPGTDTIVFNIGEGGYYTNTITPLSALPEITSPVLIDGTSQPGYEGTPIIQISGYQAGEGLSGLVISAGDSTVRGLIITQFSSYGIRLIDQGNNIIQGNYIGYDNYIFEGFLGNGEGGILIESGNNLIGGATTSERNIISGNTTGTGVLINSETAINNQVINNYIGLDSSGNSSSPNGVGVGIVNGSDNIIQENVIAGNTNTGVSVLSYGNIANNNQILSNWIGTNQYYNNSFLGNGDDGIDLAGAKNTLVQGNIIYYNQSTGVVIRGADATGNQITGNSLFNNAEGMSIQEEAQGNSITGNQIGYNNSNGISVDNSQKNNIQGNSIYENYGLGIDLGRDGVTANDEGDSDTGANALQNYPVFTSAEVVAGTATLIGYLDSEANKEYRIEIFANRTQDASGNGEGEDYRAYITVTTDDNGRADFTLSLSNAGTLYSYITGTATNPDGNTSEFSPSITLTGELPNLVITEATAPSSVGLEQSFTVNWTGKNDSSVTTGSSDWYDRVVFSKNDIYGDSDDIYLTEQFISSSNGLPLEPNETYTVSRNVTLPSSEAVGNGYLLFKTDAYNYQVESNENDNVYAQAIDIALPNLIVTNVTAPTTATAGQTITLSWTGKNDGSVTTGSSYWYDRVVFSKNDIYGDSDDIYLTESYIYSYYGLPLEPNETYTVSRNVTLPSSEAVGNGYLLFKTDAYNYQVESNENDNVYAQAIDIALPNLIVTNVTAPTTASAGQTITLSWTGKNDGSVTTGSSYWYDRVVFSKNDIYGDSDDVYLTDSYIYSYYGLPLEPNETYTVSRNVTLPSSAAVGNGYLLLRTDVYNNQTESNENDNVYAQAIDITAPNLIITNVTAPTTASASQTITLSWTGKNDSSGTTVSSNWYDRVVFSKNDIYGDSDDIYLTEQFISSSNGLPLEPNETYTVSSNVTLPSSVVSNGYLLVRTDVYNYQVEANENDNVYAQAIDITAPNLIITNFTAPSTASTRQTIAVSWTVQNQGTGVTNISWLNDRIVFSSDTVFGNGDDIYLTQILASTFANLPLDPDEAYNVTQNITLPDTVAGNGYLLVKTDYYNGQLESNKTDNIRSVAIAVNAPNLVISNPTSPPSAAVLGQTLPLSWRVTNTGTVSALAGWHDRVYLSDDGLLDSNDLSISEFGRPNSLAPNASYTNSQNIFLPATSIGDRYLLFVTDTYGWQGETNETDNVVATPITLTAPDLTVTAATAPTTAVTNGTLNVSWTVTNGGDVVASADWSDEVRLSTNTIWGDSDDRSITSGTVSIAAQTPLNPNSSYTIERTVTLPSVAAGNYHLLFRADSSNQQGETNEENNVRSLPIAIAVPDLVVAAAAAPTNGIASQSIAVSWTVTNQGTVDAAADWYDSVYLSTNNTFEGFNDVRIASDLISTQTPLLAGNSYTFTRNVTLPNRPAGDYFLLFLADDAYPWWGNSQPETDENNNVRAVPITIGVPDLTVSAATAPSSGVLGGAIDVSWTVTNTSTVTAPADWSDRIYFSTDEVWNPSSDTLITSEAIATQTPLNAGLSYTVNRTITLPNVASSGSGYLLFVADGNANQAESNENNNVRSVPFTLNAPNLTVTGATAPSSVSLGSTIAVTWTVANSGQFPANANWYDSVYLSDNETFETSDVWLGERWSGNSQPIAVGGTYTGTRNITLPTTTTGNRYLLFITDRYANYSTTFNNRQGETNENDNVFALPINISSADLVLESAIAPSGGIIGNPITLSWTVKNQGTGEAPQDWWDYVYLSLNQTLDGSDTLLVNEAISTQTPLAADGSYTINKTVNLASITPGTRYLIFVADGSGNQGEINETNNQRVVEIVVTAPDLIVSTANAPTTAITGSNIAVSWTTTNQGTSEASADWSDAVYLSGDSLFDGSDIFITSEAIASQTPLAAGASYTISRNIALPSNVSGDRFLLFVADNSNAQGEVDNTNNVRAVPIGINASAILSFSAATFRVNEDGTAIAPVTIERSGIITESVSVTLNLSNGTAIAGSDYNSSPLTVTFAPGETSKTVTIPIVNDTRFEPEETVNLTLANPSAGAVIGVQNTAVLTIVSDDLPVYGKLSFSNAQFTVREDGVAIVAVTVSRTEGSDGNVGATINLTNGTAIAPGDYNNASVTVNFTPGETSKTIVIPIVNDAIYEPDETINLTLTNPTGGATLGSQTTATLTILDNDPPQQGILAFSQSSYSINENGTAVTQVTVMRSGGSDGEVSATINLFNGSATAPSDYNSSPIIVNFANGETSKTVVIPIVNDTVYEANETINLTLSNPTGGAIIRGQNTAVVTIVDDDIELNFSSRTYNAGENGVPAAQVTVNRAGITSVPVGVTLLLRNGTATAPDDYLDTPIAVTFAPGETSKTVTIPIVDDEQLEANETILLSLVDPTNGATLGSQATASLTIASDDLPDLVVSNIVAPLDARSGGAIDVTWRVTNQGNITASGTWTDYVYLSNDATIGNDQLLGSFSFTGAITVGSSIDRTQSIFLPLTLNGEHRIIIQTNANNGLKERPGTGNNNTTIDDLPINIISNLANLQVSSIITPATAFSSQETVVEWIVTNTGVGPTNASIWYDQVWLSSDDKLDPSDVYLGQAKNASFLNPNESYRNSLAVTLPQGIEGNYHFLVRTDFSSSWNKSYAGPIIESNENDNVGASTTTQIELTPSPDLQITAVSTPTQTFSGQPMLLTWTVTNKGQGRTLLSNRIIDTGIRGTDITTEVQANNNNRSLAWYDKVYMSSDEVLDADDRYLGQYLRTGNLNPNESYTANLTVDLPIGISGDYYFLIQTDANNQIFEGIQEGNNTGYDTPATVVKLTPPPDLEIEFIQSPTQATASRSLSFTYRVTNFGATVTPNKFWTDTFYLSTDNQLDLQTDLRLGSNPRYNSLTPDAAYTNTISYTLPNTITGTYYLFGVTDSNNEVFELDNTNNIGIARNPITISSRPGDLTVAVTTSSTAEAGKSLTVNWTVTNQGTGDTAVSSWNDLILLSADNIIGNSDDIFLGNFTRNGLLNIGESYSRSGVFNLPFTLIGNYNLFVITDSFNQVYEANNEGNNTAVQTVNVSRQTADLQVTQVTAPNTAASGQPFTVTWKVQNFGSNRTNSDFWYDRVYLSSDAQISSDDIRLGDVYRSGSLSPNGEYTASQTFNLPIDLQGNYYTLVRTDSANNVFEDAFENNNDGANVGTTTISLSPTPDLIITSIDAPATAVSGQSINVTWTVRNAGTGATGDRRWYEAFYLSRDTVLDSNDTYLGFSDYRGNLAPDGSYTKTQAFRLPQSFSGNAYIFAVTDAGSQVYERSLENNNVGSTVNSFLVTLAQPTDLVVGTITIPSDAVAGRNITIGYTVNNQGANPLQGRWSDTLFFSKDNQWDINDVLFTEVANSGTVESGGSYSKTITAPLPGLAVGDYHLIIRSDIRNEIFESNDGNNLKASLDQVDVDVERLNLGTASTGTLAQGQGFYYRFNGTAGQTIRLRMDSQNNETVNSLFISRGEMPTRTKFEVTDPTPFVADPTIVLPITEDGTYYVLAYGNTSASSTPYTIIAEEIPFSILGLGVETVGNTGEVTIEVDGALFANDTSFRLVDSAGKNVNAKRTFLEDSTKAFITFDLDGKAAGIYDIQAVKTDGRVVSLNDSLTVQDNFDANLATNLDGPLQVRPQRDNTFNLIYGNNGGTDIIAPLLLVESASNSPFGLSQKSMVGGATLQILSSSQDGPLDILRPGETQSVPVYFRSSQANDLAFRIRAIKADDTTAINVEDWASIEKSIRPQGLTDTQWQNFWGEIQPRIGTTWGDYVQMLNRLSQEVSSVGEGERDVRDMFAELYGLEPNYRPASSMSGQLLDAKTGEALVGVEVGAYRTVDGVYELGGNAVTDAEGRFTISYLQAGNYDLALANKNFDMNRDGNEDFQPPSYAVSETTDLTDVTIYGHHPEPEQPQIDESETALAVDSNGVSHILWRRDGQIWHSYFNGSNWIDAAPIAGAEGSGISIQAANNLIDGNSSGLIATWQAGAGNSSEIYYAVGRAKTGGGFEWSDPIALTNDSVEDRNASLLVLQDGTVLTVGQKSNFDIDDDTDLYFNLLDVSLANLEWSNISYINTESSLIDMLYPQVQGSIEIPFKRGFDLPVPVIGGKYEIEGNAKGFFDASCEGLSVGGAGTLLLKIPFLRRGALGKKGEEQFEGSITLKGSAKINKEECVYEDPKSQLELSGTGNIEVPLPLKLLRLLNRLAPGLYLEGGGSISASVQANYEFDSLLPNTWPKYSSGNLGVNGGFYARGGTYSRKWGDNSTFDIIPESEIKLLVVAEAKATFDPFKIEQWDGKVRYERQYAGGRKVVVEFSLKNDVLPFLPFDALNTSSLADSDVNSFQQLTINNESFVGTVNVYSASSILADLSEDTYNDKPASLIQTPTGQVFGTWIKDTGSVRGQEGSVVIISEFDGTNWQLPIEVSSSLGYNQDITMAVDANGNPIIVWSMADSSSVTASSTFDEFLEAFTKTDIVYSVYQNGSWTTPNKLLAMSGVDLNPVLKTAPNGQLSLVWTNANNGQQSLMSSFWNGITWATPQTITTISTNNSIQNPSISTVDGKLTAFWSQDTNSDPEVTTNKVFYSIYNQNWATPQSFTPTFATGVESITAALETANNQNSQIIFPSSIPFTPPEDCCKCEGVKERRRIESRTGCGGRSGSETTFDKETCIETTIVYIPETCPPKDPNDIIGPIGFGQENWIANSTLPYTIRFENDPVFASAAAQEVIITQQLDADLDWRTFRLDDFGWGGLIFDLPGNTAFHSQRFNFTEEYGFLVDVTAGIDIASGIATWHIITIDPNTGDKPLGVDQGFLPVNNDEGIGEGFVSYQIRTKRTIQTGTVIDAQARIVFDTEEPIDTPPIFNTIDINAPITSVKPLAAITNNPEFLVQWQGNDDNNGSALADYTVYVSENGGTFTPWLVDTLLTEATYVGTTGNTYAFYAIASDNAGNIEITPTAAQASTRIAGGTGTIGDFVWLDKNANGIQDINESGVANITVKLYDSTNTLVTTTTTNASGNYSFNNLNTGDYYLEVIAPNGYLFSSQNQGLDNQDSDVNPTTGKTELFTVNSGNNLTWDAGLYQLASISGQVWNDIDGNAVNNSEPSLSGWTVYLDTNNNNQLDTGETTTQTNANGDYTFNNLRPGNYNVAQVVQTGWKQTYPLLNITTTAADIPLAIPTLELISPATSNQTQLNFSTSNYTVTEDGTAITEIIIIRSGNLTGTVTATLTFSDGTAKGCACAASSVNNDFNHNPITITFAENEISKVIPVQNAILNNPNAIRIRNDNKVEGNESFTINLTNPTGGATLGNQSQATVTILDDESPNNNPITPPISNPSNTLSNSQNTNATNLINLDDFWSDSRFTNIKGQGQSIVIIDTGADLNHPLFGADANNNGIADKIIYQYDFADNDTDASDKNNHGSHITSIASQIAPDANLIILKVFKDNGSGYFADLEEALQWVNTNANTYNVTSVNLSLGDNQNWTTATGRYGIGDELAAIAGQNILIAAAAGNSFYTFNSTPGLAYPAADPNVISVGAVWADDFGSGSFSNGAKDYTTAADRIASFSQRHPLLDVFAPGILITGANATGGTITMGGTSQAVPYISAIATLAQQIAQTYLGRELTLTEFRTLLDTTSNLIIDGDDENDNVTNTGISYPRINAIALAESILNLNDSNPNPDLVNPGNNNNNGSNTVTNTVSLVHNVTLTGGQILTGISFGNQQLPSNQPPTLNNINKSGNEDNPINFSQSDFTSAFNDADGNTLVKIEITALPNNGVLQLNNTAIALNQEIAVSNLNNLTFSPNTNFNGNITFSWNGFDGSVYADNAATVNITVNPVDDAPTVLNPITDVNVDEDAANTVIDLTNVFSDVDGDVIVKSVFVNNNPGLVTATIVDNQLTLDYQDNQSGIANITIRGTSNGKTVDDTFVVNVGAVDNPPTVLNPITDVNVNEDAENSVINLSNVFSDVDGDVIVKSVFVNSNPGLVTATIVDNQLTLDYQDNQSGIANITIRGTSNGKTVDDTFVVNVGAVDNPPTVLNPITDVNVDEDAANTVIDLTNVFSDVDGDVIVKSVFVNSNPGLVTATIVDNQLTLDYQDNQSGIANITIRGTSNGKTVDDTFVVNVGVVDNPPTVLNPITDVNVDEDAANTVIDLTNVFSDVDGDVIVKSVFVNSNPGLVTATIVDNQLTLDYQDNQSGIANITIRGTSNGKTVDDTFVVNVGVVDNPPTVLNPITDVNVDEDAENSVINLSNVFSDVDGDVIVKSVFVNSNPGLVTATIVDNQLTLDYQDNQSGIANITIRGTSNGKTVDDTFVVNVGVVDNPPTVLNPITDVNVDEDAENSVINLSNVFSDVDGDVIVKSVFVNSNPGLVTATIIDNQLTLDYQDNQSGIANITIRGTSNGKTVDDTFVVNVGAVDNPPTVLNPITDVNVDEDAANTVIDLTNVFSDVDGDVIVKSVFVNNNPGLVTATIVDNQLTLDYQNNQSGIANITIRGTSNGKTVDDTFVVNVGAVDNPPTVLNPITDVNVDEDAENSVINLSNVFSDVDGDVIVKSVFVNSNPGLVTATIVDNQLTLDYQNNQSGIANITIRGTSNGKTVDDTLILTVNPVNDAPTLQQEIANQTATENQPFSFTIPANTFTDIDGDNLTYTLATETVLPSGITFDAATGTFSGTPSDTASGTYNLTVIASDSAGEKANDSFSLNVLNAVNGSSSSETVNGTSGDDHINAGAGNDTVNGGEGNDTVNGGEGNDRLAGGPGDDTYIVDNSRDVAIENAGQGQDTVKSSVNYTLTVNIENITLTGNANIDGTGNNLDNVITGNSGHNLLKGLDGNDTLIGSAGNDTLIGGKGNDILTGGDGSDSFLFGSGAIFNSSDFGVDSVSDFIKGSDKIILSKTSFNALVSAVGNSLQTAEFASINDAANELNLVGSSSAKIVYNLATGNLFYNQNGATAGLGNGALFATFNGIPQLSENDIFLQA